MQTFDEGKPLGSDTMEMTNANRAYRYYNLVDNGELEAMYDLFADDIVYDRPGYALLEGLAALREFYETERVIRAGVHTVCGLIDGGDRIAVEGEFAGTLHDGSEIHLRFSDFLTFRNELIVRRNTYFHSPLV